MESERTACFLAGDNMTMVTQELPFGILISIVAAEGPRTGACARQRPRPIACTPILCLLISRSLKFIPSPFGYIVDYLESKMTFKTIDSCNQGITRYSLKIYTHV